MPDMLSDQTRVRRPRSRWASHPPFSLDCDLVEYLIMSKHEEAAWTCCGLTGSRIELMPGWLISGELQIALKTVLACPSIKLYTYSATCTLLSLMHTQILAQLNVTFSAASYTACGTRVVRFPTVCRRSVLLLILMPASSRWLPCSEALCNWRKWCSSSGGTFSQANPKARSELITWPSS